MAGQICRDVPIGLRNYPVRYCQQPNGDWRKSRLSDPGPDEIPNSEIEGTAISDILAAAGNGARGAVEAAAGAVTGAADRAESSLRWGTVAVVAVAVIAVVGALFYFVGPLVRAMR